MLNQLIVLLLSYFWNLFVDLHDPVYYDSLTTGSNVFKRDEGGLSFLTVVNQLRLTRKPRFPFPTKEVYQYEVIEFTFKDNHLIDKQTMTMPEYSSFWFRNTRVPYVLAVNAFKKLKRRGDYG